MVTSMQVTPTLLIPLDGDDPEAGSIYIQKDSIGRVETYHGTCTDIIRISNFHADLIAKIRIRIRPEMWDGLDSENTRVEEKIRIDAIENLAQEALSRHPDSIEGFNKLVRSLADRYLLRGTTELWDDKVTPVTDDIVRDKDYLRELDKALEARESTKEDLENGTDDTGDEV